jgi:ATP-dependent DNA helicase RecQ
MGIDKPDIRLVVHGDIPGSRKLPPRGGRAGRDRAPACVLLFAEEDIERQFSSQRGHGWNVMRSAPF